MPEMLNSIEDASVEYQVTKTDEDVFGAVRSIRDDIVAREIERKESVVRSGAELAFELLYHGNAPSSNLWIQKARYGNRMSGHDSYKRTGCRDSKTFILWKIWS